MQPQFGDRVVVYATSPNVQVEGIYGRWLDPQGEEVTWSEWYHRRFLDGSISLSPLTPAPAKKGM